MDGWAALATLAIVGALLFPPAVAPVPTATYPTAPRLFTVTNASNAVAGDNVSLDFYSYSSGSLTDPDSHPSVSAYPSGPYAPLSVQGMTHVGTGHYRAWTVLPSFPTGGLQRTAFSYLTASVQIAGTGATAFTSLSWIIPGLYLRFYSNVATISRVQPMHLTAELYNGSVRVDADPGTVRFQASSFLGTSGGPMTPNRTATGVYEADVVLNLSAGLGFSANATVHGILVQQTLDFRFGFPRPFTPAAYQPWFQTLSANATEIRGTLWVADAWGQAAPGVPVNLTVNGGAQFVNATTDARGRVPLTLFLVGGSARIMGYAGQGSLSMSLINVILPYASCRQGFRSGGALEASPVDPPILPGGGLRDFLAPGAGVVRTYQVVNWTTALPVPAANAPLNYYLVGYGTGRVFGTGHAVTDAQGNVTLSFTVPDEEFAVLFDVEGLPIDQGGISYSVASSAVGLHVSALSLGGPTEIKASFPSRADPWVDSGAVFALGSIGVLNEGEQNWTKWGYGYGCAEDYLRGTPDGLNTTLFLPSFLPSSARYLVDVEVLSGSEVVEQFVILSPGQSADIPVGGAAPLDLGTVALWATIGIILAAIAAVGLWIILRRRPKAPPQPPPAPPPSP